MPATPIRSAAQNTKREVSTNSRDARGCQRFDIFLLLQLDLAASDSVNFAQHNIAFTLQAVAGQQAEKK
jgi:hypothetical protein